MKINRTLYYTLVKAIVGTYLITRFLLTNHYGYIGVEVLVFIQYHLFISHTLRAENFFRNISLYYRVHKWDVVKVTISLIMFQAILSFGIYAFVNA